mgnify:CR=1 FL=1
MRHPISTHSGVRRTVLRMGRRHAFVFPGLAAIWWLVMLAIARDRITATETTIGLVMTLGAIAIGAVVWRSSNEEKAVLTARAVSTARWQLPLGELRRVIYAKIGQNALVFIFETKERELREVLLNGVPTRDLQIFIDELHRLAPSVELDLRPIRFAWPNRYMERKYALRHPKRG